jgi:hypothetical protein
MTNNPKNSTFQETKIADKRKGEHPVSEAHASYRGFTSIDQEMERAIAMQWFSPSATNIFYHGIVVKKG